MVYCLSAFSLVVIAANFPIIFDVGLGWVGARVPGPCIDIWVVPVAMSETEEIKSSITSQSLVISAFHSGVDIDTPLFPDITTLSSVEFIMILLEDRTIWLALY